MSTAGQGVPGGSNGHVPVVGAGQGASAAGAAAPAAGADAGTPVTAGATPVASIAELVRGLRAGYDSGRTRGLEWRRKQLKAGIALVTENEREILEALRVDLGKPALEGVMAEVSYTLGEARFMLKKLAGWLKPRKVSTPMMAQPGKSVLVQEPLGVVCVIAPWNYPFQLAMVPALGALAAGNTVVLKPSEVSAATSNLFARLIPRYFDASAMRVVEGGVLETSALLEQRFDHIFYTGNGAVGRVVMAAAAKHLTPVTLELGGKSPCYVDPSADLDVAARRIAWGKFYNAGQTCVAPDYILAHASVHDRLLEKLAATVKQFYGADPQRSPDYGRVVNQRHHRRLMKLLGSGEVVVGGTGDEATRYLAPTVLKNVAPDSPVMAEEIFGPILPVLKVSGPDEAITFINRREKPLALYVFAGESDVAERFIARTSSGGVTVNHAWLHLAVPELPFGGVGESGMGAYHGQSTFDTFSHMKPVLKKPFMFDPSILYPPYTEGKQKLIRKLL